MLDSGSAYPADAFIGTFLNIFGISINGYPLSFVVWNILLAIVAIIVARYLIQVLQSKKSLAIKILLSAAWLALLPNTAYLMTDARHFAGACPLDSYGNICSENAWMSVFFFAYAALGWPAFVLALRPVKSFVSARFGMRNGSIFAAAACVLSAWGVLIGLLGRFNSWDLVLHPLRVARHAMSYIITGELFANLVIVSAIFILLYALGEKIFAYGLSKDK